MIGPLQRSLKTRVTLFSLAIFILSLWTLAYYASKMLRTDMEKLLGEQQRSTVALVAANIDQELKERLIALERIAVDFNEKELQSPATLQGILERRVQLARAVLLDQSGLPAPPGLKAQRERLAHRDQLGPQVQPAQLAQPGQLAMKNFPPTFNVTAF